MNYKPFDYIKAVYSKDKSIRYVNDHWVSIYLNKALAQDADNADALSKIMEYSLYLSPNSYYYLLFLTIPKKTNYYIKPITKPVEPEEDELLSRMKEVLGWSNREYKINKREFDKVILNNRDYWNEQFAIQPKKKRTTK